jgi:hypothetical protein
MEINVSRRAWQQALVFWLIALIPVVTLPAALSYLSQNNQIFVLQLLAG